MARDSSFAEEEDDKSGYSMLVNSGSLSDIETVAAPISKRIAHVDVKNLHFGLAGLGSLSDATLRLCRARARGKWGREELESGGERNYQVVSP